MTTNVVVVSDKVRHDESFGKTVEELLKKNGLSCRQAGDRARISGTYVADMVKGKLPSWDVVEKFVRAIGEENVEVWRDLYVDASVRSESKSLFQELERISPKRRSKLIDDLKSELDRLKKLAQRSKAA